MRDTDAHVTRLECFCHGINLEMNELDGRIPLLHYCASANRFYGGYVIYIRGHIIYLARKLCSWIRPVYRLRPTTKSVHERTHAPAIFTHPAAFIVAFRSSRLFVLFIELRSSAELCNIIVKPAVTSYTYQAPFHFPPRLRGRELISRLCNNNGSKISRPERTRGTFDDLLHCLSSLRGRKLRKHDSSALQVSQREQQNDSLVYGRIVKEHCKRNEIKRSHLILFYYAALHFRDYLRGPNYSNRLLPISLPVAYLYADIRKKRNFRWVCRAATCEKSWVFCGFFYDGPWDAVW